MVSTCAHVMRMPPPPPGALKTGSMYTGYTVAGVDISDRLGVSDSVPSRFPRAAKAAGTLARCAAVPGSCAVEGMICCARAPFAPAAGGDAVAVLAESHMNGAVAAKTVPPCGPALTARLPAASAVEERSP